MDFSKIESNKMEATFEPVHLLETVTQIISIFREVIELAGIQFQIICMDTVDKQIYIDRTMFEQVIFKFVVEVNFLQILLNLVSNAFKYTLNGSIIVAISSDDKYANIAVKDTGTGISEHDLPKIFDRFFRVKV